MKELSTEEKAKRYDEALEKARQLCVYPTSKPFISDLQDLFPELKESEDEDIRKELIDFVKSRLAGFPQCEKYITWLEKQNELSIKWNKNTEGNKPSVNHSILMKTTHGISEGEWKGECWYQYRWATNHIKDSDVLAWMELSDLDKQNKSADKVVKINRDNIYD